MSRHHRAGFLSKNSNAASANISGPLMPCTPLLLARVRATVINGRAARLMAYAAIAEDREGTVLHSSRG
jgi:hypothetical protein